MHFANPKLFYLLLIIPLLIVIYLRRMRQGQGSLQFSSARAFEGIQPSWTIHFRHFLFGINVLAMALTIIALARPQKGTAIEEITADGVDIVVALDAVPF